MSIHQGMVLIGDAKQAMSEGKSQTNLPGVYGPGTAKLLALVTTVRESISKNAMFVKYLVELLKHQFTLIQKSSSSILFIISVWLFVC